MKEQKVSAKAIALTGVVAALYAVLTVAISPLSYGAVQFRFSEIMLLLIFFDRKYAPGLILGCVIANLFSPLGMIDVVVGTTATAIALWGMCHTKNRFVATLWPAAANGVLVGLELVFLDAMPFWFAASTVALGEFVVVSVIGYILFHWMQKNPQLMAAMRV